MEYPVPDLIYYERIVNNERIPEEHVRYEMEELIKDVKIYMGKIQDRENDIMLEVTKKNLFNTIEKHGGMILSSLILINIVLYFCF